MFELKLRKYVLKHSDAVKMIEAMDEEIQNLYEQTCMQEFFYFYSVESFEEAKKKKDRHITWNIRGNMPQFRSAIEGFKRKIQERVAVVDKINAARRVSENNRSYHGLGKNLFTKFESEFIDKTLDDIMRYSEPRFIFTFKCEIDGEWHDEESYDYSIEEIEKVVNNIEKYVPSSADYVFGKLD